MTTPLPRAEFPVTQRYAYLNHAAAGVLPLSSVAAIEGFLRAHAGAGVLGTFPYDAAMPQYRGKIASFIGAREGEIAIVPNSSWGANVIALGIDWQAGDEVLLCDNEFPANAVPWLALRRRGVDVRLLSTQDKRLTADVVRREASHRTRVVAVSWISYADGYRHDLNALAEAAHAVDAYLCVDAMQGLGVFPLDVRAAGVDALYAGASKWMLGLHGVGLLYVREDVGERLRLATPGWRSLQNMWDFQNYEQPFTSDAMRFESGTPNVIGALSIACAIDLFERAGQSAIAAHVIQLTDRLCEGLRRLGGELLAPRAAGVSSGIVTVSFPGRDSLELGKALHEEGIVTTYRPNGIRISPHAYNTAQEIDAALEVLERRTRTPATV